jgi:hypothetical protein
MNIKKRDSTTRNVIRLYNKTLVTQPCQTLFLIYNADRCQKIIQSAFQTCAMFGTHLARVSTVFAHTGLRGDQDERKSARNRWRTIVLIEWKPTPVSRLSAQVFGENHSVTEYNFISYSSDIKRLGRPRRRWEDNIKMNLQEVGGGCGAWMELAQDRDRWRALVSTVRNLRVPKML